MVRLDRGMRWQQPSGFPQPGTIGKLIRDRASLPGPGAFVPITTGIKGGFMSKGPMRPPTPLEILSKPGPGQYVTTEPINVHLAGYKPLHMREMKREVVQIPPPPTGKALMDFGGDSVHLMSVQDPHNTKTWEAMRRPMHTSCKPGARLIIPKPMPYKNDSYHLPHTQSRQMTRAQGRSVSSLGFYGSMVVGMGETGEITQHTPYTGKEANGGIVKKHVGSSLGERAYSSCSFGGTTEFRYEGQGVPEQEQFWEHRISRVYSMWPESKRGKKVMKYGEKHLQRRESIQNSAGTHDISAHSAFREEANDQGGKSPDSVESPLPVPASPSWTEKPRIGYLYSIEHGGKPRFGGAPQLTTHIPSNRIPSPTRFRTARNDVEDGEENEMGSGTTGQTVTGHHENKKSRSDGVAPPLPSGRRSTRGGLKTPNKPKSSHKVSMHPSVSPYPQNGQEEVWVAPASPPDRLSTKNTFNPLQFITLAATRKDNIKIYHRSFL